MYATTPYINNINKKGFNILYPKKHLLFLEFPNITNIYYTKAFFYYNLFSITMHYLFNKIFNCNQYIKHFKKLKKK